MELMEYLETEADAPLPGKRSTNNANKPDYKTRKAKVLKQMEDKYMLSKRGIQKQYPGGTGNGGSSGSSIDETES